MKTLKQCPCCNETFTEGVYGDPWGEGEEILYCSAECIEHLEELAEEGRDE